MKESCQAIIELAVNPCSDMGKRRNMLSAQTLHMIEQAGTKTRDHGHELTSGKKEKSVSTLY